MNTRHSSALRLIFCLFTTLSMAFTCASTTIAQDTSPTASPWSPEVAPILELVNKGDYTAALQRCQTTIQHAADMHVRTDTMLLQAMCLMYTGDRNELGSARGFAAKAIENDPAIGERPELLMAIGTAATTTYETAKAIEVLRKAADNFGTMGRSNEQAMALASLTRAWAVHGEWEFTAFEGGEIPRTSERALELRVEKIRGIRAEAAEIEDAIGAVQYIDFALGTLLLSNEKHRDEGLQLLVSVADSEYLSPAVFQAADAIARHFESIGDFEKAVKSYEQIIAQGIEPYAKNAKKQLRRIQTPSLLLTVPEVRPPQSPVQLHIQARNLKQIDIEIRKVDLAKWVGDQNGNYDESTLPLSGALRYKKTYATAVPEPFGWWRSDMLESPIIFKGDAGAYAVIVIATDANDDTQTLRRLLIVSSLDAVIVTGADQAFLWCNAKSEANAKFWMNGSFVPTEMEIDNNLTSFNLPGESKIFKNKEWICVIEADDHVALCRGTLPRRLHTSDVPTQVIIAGNVESPAPGDNYRIVGKLLSASTSTFEIKGDALHLEVRDAEGQIAHKTPLDVTSAGLFQVDIPVVEAMAGKPYFVTVYWGRTPIPNLRTKFNFFVARSKASFMDLDIDLPAWSGPEAKTMTAPIFARYPWGTASSDQGTGGHFQGVRLPISEENSAPAFSQSFCMHPRLDETGKGTIVESLNLLGLAAGPWLISCSVENNDFAGTPAFARASTLFNESPKHGWILHLPNQPAANQPTQFLVGWYDTESKSYVDEPFELVITHDGKKSARLPLILGDKGYQSQSWTPSSAGTYEISIAIPQIDGPAWIIKKTLEVAETSNEPNQLLPLAATATEKTVDDQPCVSVRLMGNFVGRLLVIVHGDNPIALAEVGPIEGEQIVNIPLNGLSEVATSVDVIDITGGQLNTITQVPVSRPTIVHQNALAVELPTSAQPNETIDLSVQMADDPTRPMVGSLLLRLVPWAGDGSESWSANNTSDLQSDTAASLTLTTSRRYQADVRQTAPPSTMVSASNRVHDDLNRGIMAGNSVWQQLTRVANAEVDAKVQVPLENGHYRLVAELLAADGQKYVGFADVAVQCPVSTKISHPYQLSETDSTETIITIENTSTSAVTMSITAMGDNVIQCDSPRFLFYRYETSTPTQTDSIVIPVGDIATLATRVTGLQSGTGQLAITFTQDKKIWRQTAKIKVLPTIESSQPADAQVQVRRNIFKYEQITPLPEIDEDDPETDHAGHDHHRQQQPTSNEWIRVPLANDEIVQPGQFLLIQDEIVAKKPLEKVIWHQNLPTNTHSIHSRMEEAQSLGALRDEAVDSLTYQIGRLSGTMIHEFVIVAARPGDCQVPLPEFIVGKTPISVSLESSNARITVTMRE